MDDYTVIKANEYLMDQYGLIASEMTEKELSDIMLEDSHLVDILNGKLKVSINVSKRIENNKNNRHNDMLKAFRGWR